MSEISAVLVGEVNMLPDPRKHHAVSLVKVVFFFFSFGEYNHRLAGLCWPW
jgi:hypothetical protein